MENKRQYQYKFSIVTAVYNVEAYLNDAIESLAAQDIGFTESVQLILVDDGSTDHSGEICDLYQAKYPDNIKVIHKENGGVSSARNEGLKYVQGQYVNFMDPDDKLSSNTLSEVYQYFITVDDEVDIVSIPIEYFERHSGPHPLNYKFHSKKNEVIDLWKQYTYVQMSIASSFIKNEVISSACFDTSLKYAEDAKVILEILFKTCRLGVVPKAQYLYRLRNTEDSALSSSKADKAWYIDYLEHYTNWAIQRSLEYFGFVPRFVQYNIMYDMQWRFRMQEIPEGVLTPDESRLFVSLLADAVSYVSDEIILEQKRLPRELKTYVIGMKKNSGKEMQEFFGQDGRIRYNNTLTPSFSSYPAKFKSLYFTADGIELQGILKRNAKLHQESKVYATLTCQKKAHDLSCEFHEDPDDATKFAGQVIAQTICFKINIPYSLIQKRSVLDIYITYDDHVVHCKNQVAEEEFPLQPESSVTYYYCNRYIFRMPNKKLIIEPAGLRKYVKEEYLFCKTTLKNDSNIPKKEFLTKRFQLFLRNLRHSQIPVPREPIRLQECYVNTQENLYQFSMLDEHGRKIIETAPFFSLKGLEALNVHLLSSQDYQLHLSLDDYSLSDFSEKRIIVSGARLSQLYFLDIKPGDTENDFWIDTEFLKEQLEWGKNKTFYILFEAIRDGQYHRFSLYTTPSVAPHAGRRSSRQTVFSYICEDSIILTNEEGLCPEEYMVVAGAPFSTHFLRISLCSRKRFLSLDYLCNITGFQHKKGGLSLSIEAELRNYTLKEVVFAYRSKLAEDAVEYPFQIIDQTLDGNLTRLKLFLSFQDVELKSLYWDIFLKIEDESGCEQTIAPVMYRREKFRSNFYASKHDFSNGFFLYPYTTASRNLAFQYREKNKYDSIKLPLKEGVAMILYYLLRPYWSQKHICLVYEKYCAMAQDNGYYFFRYCMDHPESISSKNEIYYVITKDSPDRSRLDKYEKHLVDFMSIRHMIYLMATEVLISTDSKSHAYIFRCRLSLLRKYVQKRKLVFLQHGVTALKKVDFFYGKGKSGGCNLFIVTSDFEKAIVRENFGYSEKEIANTGFARWDVLTDKSQNSREVLIMPSWRNWLDEVSNDDFITSDYFLHYMELLNSQRLQDILTRYDLTLNFYLHSKFREFIGDFNTQSNRMRLIAFGEVPVNEMLMKCRILITDYSSVCWDVFYLAKPVLFYQFDLDKYEEAHGSYLDMRKDLFGERAEDMNHLLDYLEEYAKDNFQLKPEYAKMHKNYYKYMDDQNSKRIYDITRKRLLDQ